MANSQNGWPVVPNTTNGRSHLTDLILPGHMPHPVRVLSGDVAKIAEWHIAHYHRRVEPIKPAGCWGWNVRKIGDGPDWSNHASATAWDLNAPDNPDGAPPSRVMTPAQIDVCHELERASDGVLRWGGDWSDPDPMHWEIVGSRAAVAKLAKRLRGVPVEKTPVMQELTAKIPVLKEGDRDDEFSGYNMITRIQRIVSADDDGVWGPKTTERIAVWCKLPPAECDTLTVPIARTIFGLSR